MGQNLWQASFLAIRLDLTLNDWYNTLMPYPYEDDEYDDEPFDYDYLGPNSADGWSSGFGGSGFDDMDGDQGVGESSMHYPEEPDYKLADWERDDHDNYLKIMSVLCQVALNRNMRMMKCMGESAGAEKHLQAIEADLNTGNCKLMNAPIKGKIRTCLYDFNPYSGTYEISVDN